MTDLVERLNAASDTCKLRIGTYRELCANAAAEIARLRADIAARDRAMQLNKEESTHWFEEAARLRARPTEEEVARVLAQHKVINGWSFSDIAAKVLALFPKVQP